MRREEVVVLLEVFLNTAKPMDENSDICSINQNSRRISGAYLADKVGNIT